MWLGPAPWAPYNAKRCDGNFSTGGNSWRSYSDYSGGGMTDWGAHHFGGATFAVDVRELQPTEVTFHDEGGKKFLTFKYPNGIDAHPQQARQGQPAGGRHSGREHAKPRPIPGYAAKGGIYADFLNCVKTREKPFRDIELAVNTAGRLPSRA